MDAAGQWSGIVGGGPERQWFQHTDADPLVPGHS